MNPIASHVPNSVESDVAWVELSSQRPGIDFPDVAQVSQHGHRPDLRVDNVTQHVVLDISRMFWK